ncbi:MAG: GNAT family N-acetyltransferase [Pseudomonadota bacterium]
MAESLTLRATIASDLPQIDALLARSYPALLKGDYPPSVMVTAVPIISRARPELVASGTYFVIEDPQGQALAAGGWSRQSARPAIAEIRHVVTDPGYVRRGLGTALFDRIFHTAEAVGVTGYNCLATRTAVPFYRALGFVEIGPVRIRLREAIVFPAVRMVRPA